MGNLNGRANAQRERERVSTNVTQSSGIHRGPRLKSNKISIKVKKGWIKKTNFYGVRQFKSLKKKMCLQMLVALSCSGDSVIDFE